MGEYLNLVKDMAIKHSPNILTALFAFIVGWILIGFAVKLINKVMDKQGVDPSLQTFLRGGIGILLKIMLLIAVAGMVGIQTTSFVAVLGALTFALGMALQGSLANFASGVLLLLFRPFKVGQLVSIQEKTGHVKELQIFNTVLTTPENKNVIIPNAVVTSGTITNFSSMGTIRIDHEIGIAYGADLKKAKTALLRVLEADPKVLNNPAPSVNVLELGDSAVTLAVRPFVVPDDYWEVYFRTLEDCKLALDDNKIEIPFPTLDINLPKT